MVYKLEEPDPKSVDENQQWERLATARLYRWGALELSASYVSHVCNFFTGPRNDNPVANLTS